MFSWWKRSDRGEAGSAARRRGSGGCGSARVRARRRGRAHCPREHRRRHRGAGDRGGGADRLVGERSPAGAVGWPVAVRLPDWCSPLSVALPPTSHTTPACWRWRSSACWPPASTCRFAGRAGRVPRRRTRGRDRRGRATATRISGPCSGIRRCWPRSLWLGRYRRAYRIQTEQAEALLAETRRAQFEAERAAALTERSRIAREIHDVLAHSLGALGIQLRPPR